ncbi:hypothetical protein [Streptomyces sp. NBC_00328]|uniref:hypothetical protein n=1 Tax=Streptomyces sp. NBC_00328 TaxID=2903646 RepID=UPI002E2C0049|nr:hypothetical protein [Streptomyces sp. NBC_00328]
MTKQIPQNQPVDIALDCAGTMVQGPAVADGVEVTAEVAGEGCEQCRSVLLGVDDPAFEAGAAASGHHHGERPDVTGEPVELGVAFTQTVQLLHIPQAELDVVELAWVDLSARDEKHPLTCGVPKCQLSL